MKKIKKLITGTLVSALSITTLGCCSNILSEKKITNQNEIVSNALNYDKTKNDITPEKIGKIIETSATTYGNKSKNKKDAVISTTNNLPYLNDNISTLELEDSLTNKVDSDYKIFVLSESPYITMTSDNDNTKFFINFKFKSSDNLENVNKNINFQNDEKYNELSLKKSMLMIYANEIYKGNVNFNEETKTQLNNHIETLRENNNLCNNPSIFKYNKRYYKNNGESKDLVFTTTNLNNNCFNIETYLSSINSIITIIEDNLTENSSFFNSKLSSSFNNFSNENLNNQTITNTSTNQEIAQIIANTLNFNNDSSLNHISNQGNSGITYDRNYLRNSQNTNKYNNQISQNNNKNIENNSKNITRNINNSNYDINSTKNNNSNLNNNNSNSTLETKNNQNTTKTNNINYLNNNNNNLNQINNKVSNNQTNNYNKNYISYNNNYKNKKNNSQNQLNNNQNNNYSTQTLNHNIESNNEIINDKTNINENNLNNNKIRYNKNFERQEVNVM